MKSPFKKLSMEKITGMDLRRANSVRRLIFGQTSRANGVIGKPGSTSNESLSISTITIAGFIHISAKMERGKLKRLASFFLV
jgi:hypothetical protein